MRPWLRPAVALLLLTPSVSHAQTLSQRFGQLFTFGNCGEPLCLSVDVAGPHGLHFIPSVTQGENDLLGFLTGSISTSLANLPFTAATGATTFEFVDGAPVASTVSAGGIFGERAQTLGRGRLLVGANVNALSMERIRGRPLDDLLLRFAHQNVGGAAMGDPIFENDIIEVHSQLDINLLVTSVFASYGLLDNLDVGVLVPIVRASLSGTSEADVLAYLDTTPHLFGTAANPSEFAEAAASGSAVGIGDIAVRVKAALFRRPMFGLGLAADVRLPTGDSANFLGSGQTSVRVLGIMSGRSGNFSPHLNAGFAVRSGERQPNSAIGALGFDHLLSDHVTLAADILADFALGDSPLHLPGFAVFDVPARRQVRLTDIPDRRDQLVDGSIGFKMDVAGGYRAITNLLVPMSDGGLRPRYLWTAGFERTF